MEDKNVLHALLYEEGFKNGFFKKPGYMMTEGLKESLQTRKDHVAVLEGLEDENIDRILKRKLVSKLSDIAVVLDGIISGNMTRLDSSIKLIQCETGNTTATLGASKAFGVENMELEALTDATANLMINNAFNILTSRFCAISLCVEHSNSIHYYEVLVSSLKDQESSILNTLEGVEVAGIKKEGNVLLFMYSECGLTIFLEMVVYGHISSVLLSDCGNVDLRYCSPSPIQVVRAKQKAPVVKFAEKEKVELFLTLLLPHGVYEVGKEFKSLLDFLMKLKNSYAGIKPNSTHECLNPALIHFDLICPCHNMLRSGGDLVYKWETKGYGVIIVLSHTIHAEFSNTDGCVALLKCIESKCYDSERVVMESLVLEPKLAIVAWYKSKVAQSIPSTTAFKGLGEATTAVGMTAKVSDIVVEATWKLADDILDRF